MLIVLWFFHVFLKFYLKHVFLCFYLLINVFNIYDLEVTHMFCIYVLLIL